MMIPLIAAVTVAAAMRATAACPAVSPHRACAKIPLPKTSVWKRRRLVRLAKIDRLEWREAQLLDFLRTARTETIVLRDERTLDVGPHLRIGPTVITRDFLGGAIIRAHVRNTGAQVGSLLLIAQLRAADGAETSASVPVDLLPSNASRDVELACPADVMPASVTWSAMNL